MIMIANIIVYLNYHVAYHGSREQLALSARIKLDGFSFLSSIKSSLRFAAMLWLLVMEVVVVGGYDGPCCLVYSD